MLLPFHVLQATLYCKYKAWLLSKEECSDPLQIENKEVNFPFSIFSPDDKVPLTAWLFERLIKEKTAVICYGKSQRVTIRLSSFAAKAQRLLETARDIVLHQQSPSFYKNPHCSECPFWNHCYPKLKERDCISLLGGMTPKVIDKYHKRGIFSITQLSYLFRPRRRGRKLQAGKFLWELKALALREQKTFVLGPPQLEQHEISIYLDFEGLPDEKFQYLLGGIIKQPGKNDITFSYWADNKESEEEQFIHLITLLNQYPEAPIYHYGSYESSTFKNVAKKYGGKVKVLLPSLEKRMINILLYLRTGVYPPTYGNGLKEVAAYLGFTWKEKDAGGWQSIGWRKSWEESRNIELKEKLQQYNQDDCYALAKVHLWLEQLTVNSQNESVVHVDQLPKHSPFKLQSNKEYGTDFQYISKAAYFDYQRSKIYWRSEKTSIQASVTGENQPPSKGKGKMRWQPKKVNQIISLPQLQACPHCGHTKLYHSHKVTSVKQTDIKFTASGVRQHVVEYRAGKVKCAACLKKANNANLRIRHYGDNLLAFVTDLYINYNISNELVSRLIREQFGIWISQMYLVMNKHKWWKQWNPEVEYIRKIILASPVIHIDETSIKLDRTGGYVWVFATTHTVFYHLTLSREADFLHPILKDYRGVIVTDFYPGYESLPVKKQKCLIHLIRDMNDDLFKNPFDEEYKIFVSHFNKLLKTIIKTIDRYGLKKRHLQKHIKDSERFYKRCIYARYKSEIANSYVKRIRKNWEQLWLFLHHDNIPWNNNNAEAAVKAFALYRRGVNGQVSQTGMNHYLPMLSIAQTCRYRNISFLDFLRVKKGVMAECERRGIAGLSTI